MSDVSTKWVGFVLSNLRGAKYALGLVGLVTLVGCANHERASMTIRAVGTTGETFYRPPQPIWDFAITNTGACPLVWESSVKVRGGYDRDYSHAGGHIDWPQGILAPGEGLLTEMIVPGATGAVWRASVEFWRISPQELQRAEENAKRIGSSPLEFCPRHRDRRGIYNDKWRR